MITASLDIADPEEFAKRLLMWHDDPVLFVLDNFGMMDTPEGRIIDHEFKIDPWQMNVLESLPRRTKGTPEYMAMVQFRRWQSKVRIAMKACAGPGKSTVLAWVGLWFLTVMGDEGKHPKGSALSITSDNLKDNLWSEISKWLNRSPILLMLFEQTAERIFCKQHPKTWFLAAKSYKKDADADTQGRTLSGQHSEFTFYLIDEAGDINPSILRAAEQGMSNCEVGLIIMAGNTTSNEGMLYQVATKLRDSWNVVSITADPLDPQRTTRVDPVWAQSMIDEYGRDNWWVMAYILGLFPPGSISALIDVDSVEAAMKRIIAPEDIAFVQKRIGGDVARFGDDMSVLFGRQGKQAYRPVQMRHNRSNEIAERWFAAKHRFGSEMDFIDSTGGWGSGVVDFARLMNFNIIEVNFSGKPIDERFFNKRAEIWWNMCQWIKQGGALPPNVPGLLKELTSVNYYYQGGKLRIEDKEQIKKRIGKSPDNADALATTFALPDMPAAFSPLGIPMNLGQSTQAPGGYDPYHDRDAKAARVEYNPYERDEFK